HRRDLLLVLLLLRGERELRDPLLRRTGLVAGLLLGALELRLELLGRGLALRRAVLPLRQIGEEFPVPEAPGVVIFLLVLAGLEAASVRTCADVDVVRLGPGVVHRLDTLGRPEGHSAAVVALLSDDLIVRAGHDRGLVTAAPVARDALHVGGGRLADRGRRKRWRLRGLDAEGIHDHAADEVDRAALLRDVLADCDQAAG